MEDKTFYPNPKTGLRNHIPLAAPATREPIDGSEGFLRVSLGFTPAWYHARLSIDFGEEWHADPVYRADCLLTMKRHLHSCFPDVEYFTPQMNEEIERTCWTISGVNGILTIPRLYGIEPAFVPNNWPDARAGMHIGKGQIPVDRPFDLDRHPVLVDLYRQMDVIRERSGPIHGYLNYQGLLNIALKVRGNDFFMDLYDDPVWSSRFLNHIADTIAALSRRVQAIQRDSGCDVDLLSMSNCVMNMVSPEQYEEFVLPIDRRLSTLYPRFGVHTCRWNADTYLHSLRKIDKMGYIDTGLETDLTRMRELFPDTRRAVLYDPVGLERFSTDTIWADFRRIAVECGPCDIVLADVEQTTSDERVQEALSIASELDREFS